MALVAITGGRGAIGSALATAFLQEGWDVILTARHVSVDAEGPGAKVVQWSLGEKTPNEILTADALVHLACDCIARRADVPQSQERAALDVVASRALYDDWVGHKPGRPFIFMSSRSAASDAPNQYGRIKWLCEQELQGPEVIVVRPGLVMVGGNSGVYSTIALMLRKMPVIPVPTTSVPKFYLVNPKDISRAVIDAAQTPGPRDVVLVEDGPYNVRAMFANICAREKINPPLFIPIPAIAILGAAALGAKLNVRWVGFKERINGLWG